MTRGLRHPLLALALFALLALPSAAYGHGTEEEPMPGGEQPGGKPGPPGMTMDEAEVKALSKQPARILAQQSLAELRVRKNTHEAGARLDAALESKDKSDIDVAVLRRATETLDAGNAAGAIPLLDEALSRPLGAKSGKALHEAGREFKPATGTQEVVGIAAGAVLLLLGLLSLAVGQRRRRAAS